MRQKAKITERGFALLLCGILLVSLIPVFVISFDNHPYYDDYGYTILPREAWRQTGSVWQTFRAAVKNVIATRQTWETNYSNTFLHSFQPTSFGEDGYWICTFLITGALLAAVGCVCGLFLRKLLRATRSASWSVWAAISLVAIQFVPCARETFFWNSGGMAYTFLWSAAIIRACCLVRLQLTRHKGHAVGWYTASFILTAVVGGAKFTTLLFALLIDAGLMVYVFVKKTPRKWAQFFLTLMLALLFVTCLTGEGNAQRAKTMQSNIGAVKAVAESVYFGLGLCGDWFNAQSCFVWLVSAIVLLPSLHGSSFGFRLPGAVTALLAALFCAQLAPTVYTGLYLGDGRVINSYYFTFLLFTDGLILYWLGWAMRRFEQIGITRWQSGADRRLSLPVCLIALCLLAVGTAAWKPSGAVSYGPQNTPGGSAARSLLNGEAAAFDRAMDERIRLLEDESQTDVVLTRVTNVPFVFMGDSVDIENQEYTLNLYAEYFHKNSVALKKEE